MYMYISSCRQGAAAGAGLATARKIRLRKANYSYKLYVNLHDILVCMIRCEWGHHVKLVKLNPR